MTGFLQGGVWLRSDCCYSLNQLDMLDQWDLQYLETLRAFGFLNTVDPLVSVSNYYLAHQLERVRRKVKAINHIHVNKPNYKHNDVYSIYNACMRKCMHKYG